MLPGTSDVRDVLQEVNMFLWQKMAEFEAGSNFGAWACTVAYYKVLDHRRKLKKDGVLVFNNDLCELLTEDSIELPQEVDQKRSALSQCLGKLNNGERELLLARYQNKKGSMDEVSQITGRSRASLRVTLSRLRDKLRNCIIQRLAMEGGVA